MILSLFAKVPLLRHFFHFVVCVSASFTTSTVLASEQAEVANLSPDELLNKMAENAQSLSYQGTFIYSYGNRLETLQIYHSNKDGVLRERLVHLNGERRETIRHEDSVVCVHPKNGVVSLENTIPAGPFARNYHESIQSLNEYYTVRLGGETRIAGRPAVQIALLPKDQYRYGFYLGLDKETGLLLGSYMLDNKNKVLERFEYTSIDIGVEVAPEMLSLSADARAAGLEVVDVKSAPKAVRPSADNAARSHAAAPIHEWQLTWLPMGFTMSSADIRQSKENDVQNSLMYSDGLSAFSVFVEKDVMMKNSHILNGSTIAYTQSKRDEKGIYAVTVVGEIPLQAAQRIANSVVRSTLKPN